jgi:hypothetical protein
MAATTRDSKDSQPAANSAHAAKDAEKSKGTSEGKLSQVLFARCPIVKPMSWRLLHCKPWTANIEVSRMGGIVSMASIAII